MSNMSERSIDVATTLHEGPHGMDQLAHELAHAALAYVKQTDSESFSSLRDAAQRFEDAVFCMDQVRESGNHTYRSVLSRLARVHAEACAEFPDDYALRNDLLEKYKRFRRGLIALGHSSQTTDP